MNTSGIISILKSKGFRITKNRKKIIEVIFSSKQPLNASYLLNILNTSYRKIHKTTVYRELEFLKREKIIHEVNLSKDMLYFESSYLKPHHHIVCQTCGTIEDIYHCYFDQLTKGIKNKGWIINSHSFEIFGRCSVCA